MLRTGVGLTHTLVLDFPASVKLLHCKVLETPQNYLLLLLLLLKDSRAQGQWLQLCGPLHPHPPWAFMSCNGDTFTIFTLPLLFFIIIIINYSPQYSFACKLQYLTIDLHKENLYRLKSAYNTRNIQKRLPYCVPDCQETQSGDRR